jgi:hypothetical protein
MHTTEYRIAENFRWTKLLLPSLAIAEFFGGKKY